MQIRMAKGNFTEDGPKKTLTELFCSTGLTAELHGHMTFTLVLKSFQYATAFIGNAVILIAFYKESSLHPPSKLLLRCLAAADLCVGLIKTRQWPRVHDTTLPQGQLYRAFICENVVTVGQVKVNLHDYSTLIRSHNRGQRP